MARELESYSPEVQRLAWKGDARQLRQWPDRNPDYVVEFGLTPAHVPELVELAASRADDDREWPKDDSVDAPLHAWRALAQLGAAEAVGPLAAMMNDLDQAGDDWYLEEFPDAFGLIGPPAMGPLAAYVADPANREFPRIAASHGLREIGKRHPHVRD